MTREEALEVFAAAALYISVRMDPAYLSMFAEEAPVPVEDLLEWGKSILPEDTNQLDRVREAVQSIVPSNKAN